MQPEGIHLGPLRIGWYGLMLGMGFLAGLWTARRRAPVAGVPADWFKDIFVLTLAAALIGSRLWHVIESWDEKYRQAPWWEMFAFAHGGLTYYGGLFGAAATVVGYACWRRVSFWKLADVISPSVALGYALTRIGCFMNGCCWGCSTSVPWAVCFPASHPTHGEPVHPTQLYNAALNFLLYVALECIYRRRQFECQVLASYLIGYGCVRFATEFLRADSLHDVLGWLTTSQTVSAGVFAAGVALWIWKSRRPPANRFTP